MDEALADRGHAEPAGSPPTRRSAYPDRAAVALGAEDLVVATPGGLGEPVTFTAPRGELSVHVQGERGSAELVLALAGRFRPASGHLVSLGGPADERSLRQRVVVGRVIDAVEPEPRLTVGEYLDSQAALHPRSGARRAAKKCLDLVGLDPSALGTPLERLSPADMIRTCAAAGLQVQPTAVVIDRADRGLLDEEWRALAGDLARAAEASGVAIIVTATRSAPPSPGAVLPAPAGEVTAVAPSNDEDREGSRS